MDSAIKNIYLTIFQKYYLLRRYVGVITINYSIIMRCKPALNVVYWRGVSSKIR